MRKILYPLMKFTFIALALFTLLSSGGGHLPVGLN
jgi:hypothetical protein